MNFINFPVPFSELFAIPVPEMVINTQKTVMCSRNNAKQKYCRLNENYGRNLIPPTTGKEAGSVSSPGV